VLAMTTAPEAFTRVVTGASCSDRKSAHCAMPTVVRRPLTLIDSFSVMGSPSSGARSPRARAASAPSATERARSQSVSTIALSAAWWRWIRRGYRSSNSTADTRLASSAASISVAVAKASSRFGIVCVPPRIMTRGRLVAYEPRRGAPDPQTARAPECTYLALGGRVRHGVVRDPSPHLDFARWEPRDRHRGTRSNDRSGDGRVRGAHGRHPAASADDRGHHLPVHPRGPRVLRRPRAPVAGAAAWGRDGTAHL